MEEIYEYEDFYEVLQNCVIPSLHGSLQQIFTVLFINFIFNLSTQTVILSSTAFNLISCTLGVLLFHLVMIDSNIFHFMAFLLVAYILIYVTHRIRISKWISVEYLIATPCIGYLLLCEFIYEEEWMQSRGLFMVATMKIISLSSDLQCELELPSIVAFFGYTCNPATSIFGTWIPFKEYISVKDVPYRKNFNWIKRIFITLIVSFSFLTISNCWGTYFIPDHLPKWLVAYRQALSFRTSHYFISYLSEASTIIAGYNDAKHGSKSTKWSYQVTNPLDIEFPSSLVSVVISWNIPMHKFLKKYVYKVSLPLGTFYAILITYLVSSLLHGFNMEIAAVLLTIGLYSYIQLKFQNKLSSEFSACLHVRPCKQCNHKYRRNSIITKLCHLVFSLLTIFNLIYLGVLMDGIGNSDTPSVYAKWEHLDFLSHWIMLILYIYTII